MSYQRRLSRTLAFATAMSLLASLVSPGLAQAAERMQSTNYIIQMGNFNVTAGEKSGGGYKVTDTVGEIAPGQYGTTGYRVLAGFQYIYTIPRFTFRILNLSVNLGELTPGVFATTSHEMVITTRAAGFRILASADHQLRLPGGAGQPTIPATNCDVSCSLSTANVWSNATRYGFGYNVAGTHKSSDFTDTTYYRPFADLEAAETAQTIAQHSGVVRDEVYTVRYRASIAGTQAAGNYQTAINYTAIPGY